MSQPEESAKLSGDAHERIAAECARLKQRRDRLEAERDNDRGTVGDHGDAADAIQRAEELAVIDDRINDLDWILRTGTAPANGNDTLPNGTEVTLRFADGAVETMQVVSVVEETPAGREAETLAAASPLGLALTGHRPGDTVAYVTPQGENHVELLDLKIPT